MGEAVGEWEEGDEADPTPHGWCSVMKAIERISVTSAEGGRTSNAELSFSLSAFLPPPPPHALRRSPFRVSGKALRPSLPV